MRKLFIFLGVVWLTITLTACGKQKKSDNPSETEKKDKPNYTSDINVVTSIEDGITNDTTWCGTFNLVWNILKDEYVKGDIVVDNPTDQVINLNKTKFNKSYLSENGYYTKFGKQTPALKKEIEEAIDKKFNQKSDILDQFVWEENTTKDFIYSMLYKKFTFNTPFTQLENNDFDGEGNFRYFGIDDKDRAGIDQVDVLYYSTSKQDYAVKLQTKENEEIILAYTQDDIKNFSDYYKYITDETSKYEGNKKMDNKDVLMVPYLKFNLLKELESLENLKFKTAAGEERYIAKAIQSIQFQLSESGGDIKSEAGISTEITSAIDPDDQPRYFTYNKPFIIFLKEKDKELPYLAAYLTDLSKFQK